MRRLLLPLFLALAGCQPLPQPFADVRETRLPALKPLDSAGVVVAPVAGAPDAAGDALAKALRDSDVPASTTGGNRESFRLEAQVNREAGHVMLAWLLRDSRGKTLGHGTAQEPDSPDGATLWSALAATAAPRIVAIVSGNAPPEADDVPAAVKVSGVTGAPGDGGTALARAIGSALGHAGVAVGEGDARFALSCAVAVSPPADGKQFVTVRWTLALPEGKPLGAVSQQNTVPAGSLDGAWGEIADAVAGAAAPGIKQLIERAEE